MKDKAFAKGVSREDVMIGAQELGVDGDMDAHIQFVIDAMRRSADAIRLAGVPAPSAPAAAPAASAGESR
jgi:hypothetical protein